MRSTHAVALGLTLLAATACSSGPGTAAPAPTVTVTVTATPVLTHDQILKATEEILASASANSAPTTPSGPASTISPGTYLVGEDVKAGTYKTAGPSDSALPNCYWSRSKDSSGELSAIIANELLPGPGRVTVRKGETFETSGCEAWQLTS